MALTPKQEKFCQGVVSGMTYKDAYIAAYDTNASESVLYNESSKLALRDDIRARIADMTKPLAETARQTALTDRERKRTWLWSVIDNPEVSYNDRLRATDILNKMDSEYLNINVNKNSDDTTLSGLDMDALKKLTE